jgi:hypothetical protein
VKLPFGFILAKPLPGLCIPDVRHEMKIENNDVKKDLNV